MSISASFSNIEAATEVSLNANAAFFIGISVTDCVVGSYPIGGTILEPGASLLSPAIGLSLPNPSAKDIPPKKVFLP